MTAELVTSFPRRTLPVGDGDSKFEQFYARYYPCILGYVWKVFGSAEAEDIAQETMARAFANFDRLDPDRDPWPWLTVVARRIGTDVARSHSRTVVVEDERLADMPSADETPFDHVLANDDRRALRHALSQLSASDRRVLRLREFDDLSASDMAALLECSETAVRQQLFRARKRLTERFKAIGALSAFPAVFLGRLGRARRAATQSLGGTLTASTVAMGTLAVVGGGAMVVGMNQAPRSVALDSSVATVSTESYETGADRPEGYTAAGPATAVSHVTMTGTTGQPPQQTLDVDVDSEGSPRDRFKKGESQSHYVSVVVLGNRVVRIGTAHDNPEDYGPVCSTAVIVCE